MKHKKIFIAFLVALAIAGSIFLFYYWLNVDSSPHAKTLRKFFYYAETCEYWDDPLPIEGLAVNVTYEGDFLDIYYTDSLGKIELCQVPDGEFNFKWLWGGKQGSEDVTVDCSKLLWEYENYLCAKCGGATSQGRITLLLAFRFCC